MTPTSQIDKLVEKLAELTNRGKVEWHYTADETTFLTAVSKQTVTISQIDPETDRPGYVLKIANQEGTIVEEREQFDPKSPFFVDRLLGHGSNYQQLKSLYEGARRSAFHVEQVLSEMLSSLEQIK